MKHLFWVKLIKRLLPALLICLLPLNVCARDQIIKIGALANRGYDECLKRWAPTAAYLTKKAPPSEEKGRSMGFLSWKFLLVLICILVVNACGGLAQGKNEQAADHMNSGIANKDYNKLLSKAQAAGSVRVIVKLNMPFVPEGQLSTPQEAVDQQVRISRMQDQL